MWGFPYMVEWLRGVFPTGDFPTVWCFPHGARAYVGLSPRSRGSFPTGEIPTLTDRSLVWFSPQGRCGVFPTLSSAGVWGKSYDRLAWILIGIDLDRGSGSKSDPIKYYAKRGSVWILIGIDLCLKQDPIRSREAGEGSGRAGDPVGAGELRAEAESF